MEPVYIDLELRQNVDTESKKATDAISDLERESLSATRKAEQGLQRSVALQKQQLAKLKEEIAKIKNEISKNANLANEALAKPQVGEQNKHLKAIREAEEELERSISRQKEQIAKLQAEMSNIKAEIQRNSEEASRLLKMPVEKLQSDSVAYTKQAEEELRRSIALQKQYLAKLQADIARIKADMKGGGDYAKGLLKKPLEQLERELIDETQGLKHLQAELQLTTQAKESLATKIRLVKDEMHQLQLAGEGNSKSYQELRAKLGQLNDAYQAVTKEQRLMTKGGGNLAGIISGLQALSGAIASVVGSVGMISGESERYARIQTKVQSLLAVTIGLQQVQQSLSATSAFRLRTLTSITAGYTRAIKGLSVALRISEASAKALMGALTLGLSLLVTWGLSALDKYLSKQRELREATLAYQQAVAQAYAPQVVKFEELRRAYQALGREETKRREFVQKHKSDFDELGVSIDNALEADNLFIDNAEAFKESLRSRAESMAGMQMAVEKYREALELEMQADERASKTNFWDKFGAFISNLGLARMGHAPTSTATEFAKSASNSLREEAEKVRAEGDRLINLSQEAKDKSEQILASANIEARDGSKDSSISNDKTYLSERKRAEERLQQFLKDASKEALAIEIAGIQNARQRKLRELKEEYEERRQLIESQLKEIAEIEKTYRIDGSKETTKLNELKNALAKKYEVDVANENNASNAILSVLESSIDQRSSNRLEEQLNSIHNFYTKAEERAREHAGSEAELEELLTKIHAQALQERELAQKEHDLRVLDSSERVELRRLQMVSQGYTLQADREEEYLEKRLELSKKRLAKLEELEASGGDASEAIADATQEIEELGNALKEIPGKRIGEIGQGIQGIFSSLSSIGGEMGEVFNTAASAVGNILSSLKKGATTMDLLGNAVAGIMQVVSMVSQQSKANAEAEKKYAEQIEASYHRLALARIKAFASKEGNIFGVENPYKNAINGAKRYRQAMTELNQSIQKLGRGHVQTGTTKVVSGKNIATGALGGAAAGAAIGSAIPVIGTLLGGVIGGFLGGIFGAASKKTVPVFRSLTQQYGTILKEGSKSFELNPKILADYDRLDDATKKLVDNWEEIRKEALEAQKEMRETFKKLAGDIGDLLGKALSDAFRSGEWETEMDNFERKLDEMIGRILDQLIFSAVFGREFEKLQKSMEESFKEGGDQSITDDIIDFKRNYRKLVEEYKRAKEEARIELKEQDVDAWADNSRREAVSRRGLAQASQDSINELMGIATNQLLQLRLLVEQGKGMTSTDKLRGQILQSISRNVELIASHTQHLSLLKELTKELTKDVASLKKEGIVIKK